MAWRAPVTSERLDLSSDGVWRPFVDSDGNAIILFPKPREVVHFVFSIASEVAETTDLDWQVLGGNRIIVSSALGTVADASNMDLASGDSQPNDYYMGMYLNMVSGGEIADLGLIGDYVNSTDAIVLVSALSGVPTIGELYDIYHLSEIADGSGSITAETTLTEALPQNDEFGASGYPVLIPRAKTTTDNHIALMTYTIDGVDA